MGNREFFKGVRSGQMSIKDIFSDVLRKHTPEEEAGVFTAGTALTTPKKEEMLAGWVKPFVFARFFMTWLIGIILLYFLFFSLEYSGAFYLMLVAIPFLVPVTMLLLAWEMHIPRSISLIEILKIVGIGGILSIFIAWIGFSGVPIEEAMWAGLIEEPAKLLIICLFLKNKKHPYILNGVLIGMAVGTGFAAFESLIYTFSYYDGAGAAIGLHVALVRAFSAISGHGLWAALYGGALAMVKGEEDLSARHFLSFGFLKYFAIAILLHAFHNMGIHMGLPEFFGGVLQSEWILEAIIACSIFLNLLKMGVNQIVTISVKENGGRVTKAVNRGVTRLEFITGPYAGQTFELSEGQTLSLGRAAGRNDITLTGCQNVSGTHCQISLRGNLFFIKDLNSTNGTFIGNERLAPQQEIPITDKVEVYLGNKNCGFRVKTH